MQNIIIQELAKEFEEDFLREEGLYEIIYRDEKFCAKISKEKLLKYIDISVRLYFSTNKKIKKDNIHSDEFPHVEDYDSIENISKMLELFAPDGLLRDMDILTTADKIAELRGYPIASAAWILLSKPSVLSVVYSAAEQIIYLTEKNELYFEREKSYFGKDWDEKEWAKFFSSFICRSLLALEYGKN